MGREFRADEDVVVAVAVEQLVHFVERLDEATAEAESERRQHRVADLAAGDLAGGCDELGVGLPVRVDR